MEIDGLVSALIAGLIIGALGRLLVPGTGNMGCLLTILLGLAGAAIGFGVGASLGTGFWLTLVLQVVAAALLVSVFTMARRR